MSSPARAQRLRTVPRHCERRRKRPHPPRFGYAPPRENQFASVAREQNGHMQSKFVALLQQAPNLSIERTSQRPLRALWPTAHVER